MIILCFYRSSSYIYNWALHVDKLYDIFHILFLFPIISNISIPVNNSNPTHVFFDHACHAKHEADKK